MSLVFGVVAKIQYCFSRLHCHVESAIEWEIPHVSTNIFEYQFLTLRHVAKAFNDVFQEADLAEIKRQSISGSCSVHSRDLVLLIVVNECLLFS